VKSFHVLEACSLVTATTRQYKFKHLKETTRLNFSCFVVEYSVAIFWNNKQLFLKSPQLDILLWSILEVKYAILNWSAQGGIIAPVEWMATSLRRLSCHKMLHCQFRAVSVSHPSANKTLRHPVQKHTCASCCYLVVVLWVSPEETRHLASLVLSPFGKSGIRSSDTSVLQFYVKITVTIGEILPHNADSTKLCFHYFPKTLWRLQFVSKIILANV
jgi:hypothetical protein